MLLRSATFHNIGPFKDFKLDVGDLRGLVALIAPNGTGKSFSIEAALPGVCFREMPTQGSLKHRATDRDAWVESKITHGRQLTIRQVVDGVSKAVETLVTDADLQPVLTDTKVSTFDIWAKRNLPDNDVYLAGPFCAQKSQGFAGMESADRIAVVLRVLGVARLERMAKSAGARANVEETAFKTLVARIVDACGADPGTAAAETALAAARAATEQAEALVVAAKAALAARREEASAHAVRKASRASAEALITTLREQVTAASVRRADADVRLAGNRKFQAEAVEIRAAAAWLEAANAELTRLEIAVAEADAAIRGLLDPWRDGAARLKAAEQRRANAAARLKDDSSIRQAVTDLPGLKTAADAARADAAAVEGEYAASLTKRIAGADERVTSLRGGLRAIPSALAPDDKDDIAAATLATDDAAAAAAQSEPAERQALQERLNDARDRVAVAQRKLADAEKLAARLADLDAAKADRVAAEREAGELRTGHAVAVLSAALRALGRSALAADAAAKAEALKLTRTLAGRLAPLEASAERIVELEQTIATAAAEVARAEEQIAGIELVDVGEATDLAAAEDSLAKAEAAAKEQSVALAKADESIARARAAADRVAALEAERDAVAAELADWNRLALDLGRKGIQSAEVDSAGPELTTLTNDLLRKCHGPRYTVTVQTQRLDAKGKNLVDECNIRVIDSVKGTDKEVSEHSGGECTILAEALSLALTMMGCQRAGFRDFTIVRDESGAALDPSNNRAYVAMLRHAIAVTGARHVLLVSHSKEVQEMCDHVIEIPAAA